MWSLVAWWWVCALLPHVKANHGFDPSDSSTQTYEYRPTRVSWDDANAASQAAGGYLVSLLSEDEITKLLYQFQQDSSVVLQEAWTGAKQEDGQTRYWEWTDPNMVQDNTKRFWDETNKRTINLNYENWADGEPGKTDKRRAFMDSTGQEYAANANNLKAFVIEFDKAHSMGAAGYLLKFSKDIPNIQQTSHFYRFRFDVTPDHAGEAVHFVADVGDSNLEPVNHRMSIICRHNHITTGTIYGNNGQRLDGNPASTLELSWSNSPAGFFWCEVSGDQISLSTFNVRASVVLLVSEYATGEEIEPQNGVQLLQFSVGLDPPLADKALSVRLSKRTTDLCATGYFVRPGYTIAGTPTGALGTNTGSTSPTVTDCAVCAERCDATVGCSSYECDYSSQGTAACNCDLNNVAEPDSKGTGPHSLCSKVQAMMLNVQNPSASEAGPPDWDLALARSGSKIIVRHCWDCAPTHAHVYYRRYTPTGSLLQNLRLLFLGTWTATGNVRGTDFDLFSNYEDALAGVNAWTACSEFDRNGVGFPGDCGPSSLSTDQWNSASEANTRTTYEYELLGPLDTPKIYVDTKPMASETLHTVLYNSFDTSPRQATQFTDLIVRPDFLEPKYYIAVSSAYPDYMVVATVVDVESLAVDAGYTTPDLSVARVRLMEFVPTYAIASGWAATVAWTLNTGSTAELVELRYSTSQMPDATSFGTKVVQGSGSFTVTFEEGETLSMLVRSYTRPLHYVGCYASISALSTSALSTPDECRATCVATAPTAEFFALQTACACLDPALAGYETPLDETDCGASLPGYPVYTTRAAWASRGMDGFNDEPLSYTFTVRVSDPEIDNLSAASRPTAGNFYLDILGRYFHPDSTVTIDGRPCTGPEVTNSGQNLRCFVREGEGMTNAVVLSGPSAFYGTATTVMAYDPPVITKAIYSGVSTEGNDVDPLVQLSGRNFGRSGYAVVRVNNVLWTVDASSTHTTLSLLVEPGQGINLPIALTVVDQSTISTDTFSYAPPSVSAIAPFNGETLGGYPAEVEGLNFGNGATGFVVEIGGLPCANPTRSVDHRKITCQIPESPFPDRVLVVVKIEGIASTDKIYFTYDSLAFNETAIPPEPRPTDGGVIVRVHGSNFGSSAAGAQVAITPVAMPTVFVTAVTWFHTFIEFTLPPGHGGATLYLTNDPSVTTTFDYSIPVIDSLVHPTVNTNGGKLTLVGSNFGPAAEVVDAELSAGYRNAISITVGGQPCPLQTNKPASEAGKFICDAPPGSGHDLDVVVTVASRSSAPYPFTYPRPSINDITLNGLAEPLAQQEVEITGDNFGVAPSDNYGSVTLANQPCEVVSTANWGHNAIRCNLPVGQGRNNVTVCINAQCSDPFAFEFKGPSITAVTWTVGQASTRGSWEVVILGSAFGSVVPVVTLDNGLRTGDCSVDSTQFTDSRLVCLMPAESGPNWAFTVTSSGKTSNVGADLVSYDSPTVRASTPPTDDTVSTELLLTGSNFGTDASRVSVTLDNKPCVLSGGLDHEALSCTIDAGTGTGLKAQVTVDGLISALVDVFSFNPPTITGVECAGGVVVAGTPNAAAGCSTSAGALTIDGTNFGTACATGACPGVDVYVGALQCTDIAVVSHLQLTCTYASNVVGGYNLDVAVTVGGRSTTEIAFSYAGPTIDPESLVVTAKPPGTTVSGGTVVGTPSYNAWALDDSYVSAVDLIRVTFDGSSFGNSGWGVTYGPLGTEDAFVCAVDEPSSNNAHIECVLPTEASSAGQNLRFTLTTSAGTKSLPSDDHISFPRPELVPLSWKDGDASNVYVSDSSKDVVTFDAKHVGTFPPFIKVTYNESRFECKVLEATNVSPGSATSSVRCEASPGVGGPYLLSVSALGYVSVEGPLAFRYPDPPVVEAVWGCEEAAQPGYTHLCPTAGGTRIFLTGDFQLSSQVNITASSIKIFVGPNRCLGLSPEYNNTFLSCSLPEGAGYESSIVVVAGSRNSQPFRGLSYAPPIIETVTGCATGLATDCAQAGGDTITLTGTNLGARDALVLVGGKRCTSVTHIGTGAAAHTQVECTLPSGKDRQSILLVQDGGEVMVNSSLSVDYVPCVAGTHSKGGSETGCVACEAGTFSDAPGLPSCLACAEGYYANASNFETCLACPVGTIGVPLGGGIGAVNCTVCGQGEYAELEGLSECQICDTGRYQPSTAASVCLPCPQGFFNGATRQSACQPCPKATYSTGEGAMRCETCPAGTFGNEFNLTACLPCGEGTYSKAGAENCIECAEGRATPNQRQDSCPLCVPGRFANVSGMSLCLACPTGTQQAQQGQASCVPCVNREYQDNGGQAACLACPAGFACPTEGLEDAIECAPGSYSGLKSLVCTNCTLGTYAPSSGASTCTECGIGHYSAAVGAQGCVECAPGFYQDDIGQSACIPCPGGTALAIGGRSVCGPCAPGRVAMGLNNTLCTLCPDGHSTAGLAGAATCSLCLAGKYAPRGSAGCSACEPGRYSSDGSSACSDCPAGATPNDLKTACDNCTAGSYNPNERGVACPACPAGTFTDAEGASTCTKCPVGTAGNSQGLQSCSPCAKGKFAFNEGSLLCLVCPKGKRSNLEEGSTNCTACPVGTAQDQAGRSQCVPCPAGEANAATGQVSCGKCRGGKYSIGVGNTECTVCQPGRFAEVPGSKSCSLCPPGKKQTDEGQLACKPCPSGSFASGEGTVECTKCPDGTFMPSTGDGVSCSACVPGKYSRGFRPTKCSDCARGFYAPNPGSGNCTVAEVGSFVNDRASAISLPCPPGMFNNNTGQSTCQRCQIGSFSNQNGSVACTACPIGSAQSTSGLTFCGVCTNGTAQPSVGQSTCMDCAPGSFATGVGNQNCTKCPAGTRAANPRSNVCIPCRPGTAAGAGATECFACEDTSISLSFGSAVCSSCPDNAKANNQRTACECAQGYASRFIEANQNVRCDKCPEGADCDTLGTTWESMLPFEGYWEEGKEFYRCLYEAHCAGGALGCSGNRIGALCAQCEARHTTDYNGNCIPCSAESANILLLVLFALLLVVLFVLQYFVILKSANSLTEASKLVEIERRRREHLAMTRIEPDSDTDNDAEVQDALDQSDATTTTTTTEVITTTTIVTTDNGTATTTSTHESSQGASHHRDTDGSAGGLGAGGLGAGDLGAGGGGGGGVAFNPYATWIKEDCVEDKEDVIDDLESTVEERALAKNLRHVPQLSLYSSPTPLPNFTFKLKIALGFAQIVTNMAIALEIRWPATFKRFIVMFDILNLNIFKGTGVECVFETNYFSEMWFYCVAVAIPLIGIWLFYYLPAFLCVRHHDDSRALRKSYRQKAWRCVFYTLFLIYPAVSSKIIRSYQCKTVRGELYLVADFSIKCTDQAWINHAYSAIPMIALYPIAIPLFFFIMIARYSRNGRLDEPGVRAELGLIYDGYERTSWYFEMCDMAHKLMMTCLVAFLPGGLEMPVAMVLATLYMMLILASKPYLRKGDDRLHLVAQTELIMLLMAGHVFNFEEPDDVMELIMSVVLITAFLMFFAVFLVGALSVLKKIWATDHRRKNCTDSINRAVVARLMRVRPLAALIKKKRAKEARSKTAKPGVECFNGLEDKWEVGAPSVTKQQRRIFRELREGAKLRPQQAQARGPAAGVLSPYNRHRSLFAGPNAVLARRSKGSSNASNSSRNYHENPLAGGSSSDEEEVRVVGV